MAALTCTCTSPTTTVTTKLPNNKIISFPRSVFFKPNKQIFPTLTPPKSSPSPSDLSPIDSSAPLSPATSSFSLKSRLRNNETLYGLFLLSFSPTLAEISGLAGYDFVVVDMEHGPGGISDALACLRALGATRTPAILRLPESCPTWAKKALDLGPQGIMFPMIESPKDAKKGGVVLPISTCWSSRIGSYGG
ncbi:hypothetical protein Pint_14835 [Pistacia integerrima]|uniref:Uncharacterized protein n=1 Tax=Pistacia integerrima TaxID=434235 RepID=A0ACC0ZBM8_9ROSI|nr:hypothetical protein Pint_14835 [Pistacia integerrima]